jgi:hypothetical protein
MNYVSAVPPEEKILSLANSNLQNDLDPVTVFRPGFHVVCALASRGCISPDLRELDMWQK